MDIPKSRSNCVSFDGGGDFLKTVRARVHDALSAGRLKGDPKLQRKALLVGTWFLASFVLLFCVQSVWLQAVLCFSYGLAASAVGFNIFHDANHGAISSRRGVNVATAILASSVLGASRYLWSYKHHILHHRFTNIQGWDDDLETRGFLRISPHQDWKPRYRGQHFFVFALYAINAIELVFVKDFVQYFTLRMNEHQAIPPMSKMEKLEFWAGKAFYFAIFLGIPLALLPFGHVVVGFLIYQVTLGMSLALVFSMAHQVENADFPAPVGASPVISEEWAAHQMRTTVNFANSSPAWNWFSGGLNHQIEHHLFPAISHTHYPAIRKIVSGTAQEFQLPYKQFDSYGQALTSHYRFLQKLSLRPAQ